MAIAIIMGFNELSESVECTELNTDLLYRLSTNLANKIRDMSDLRKLRLLAMALVFPDQMN